LQELPAVRESELRCACAALGVEPPQLLEYQDGQLMGVDPEELSEHILGRVAEVNPQVLLSFGSDGLSGHADHIAVGWAAGQAFARWEDLAALYTMAVPRSLAEKLEMHRIRSVPDEQIALDVDVGPAWEAKRSAMDCQESQRGSTPLMSAPETQQQFFGREYFVRAACRQPQRDFMPRLLREYCR
jgi:LmbE family N-acetylglucosaminyl deacetylase